MLVGGSVRDRLLKIDSKDFDIEVYGLQPDCLRAVLEGIGPVNAVGEHFSVYKLVFWPADRDEESAPLEEQAGEKDRHERFEIDISLPRRESKSGLGHRGFVIEGDPSMSFEDAARRRDFTINAILFDPLTDETIDPFGGKKDLERRILRVVSADTFVEDSLRVLRAVQLAARFEMVIDPHTVSLCRTIDLSDLPHERIWAEMEKLLTLATRPSIGLQAAFDLHVLKNAFPEFLSLVERQDHTGAEDLFTQTKRALDAAVNLTTGLSHSRRMAVMLATLCYRLGADQTRSVLDRLGLYTIGGYDVRSQVLSLIRESRTAEQFYGRLDSINDGDIRRLAQRVEIDLLYRVEKAWALGSGASTNPADLLLDRARSLGVENGPPAPLLMGRHLVEAGIEPGPELGRLLRSAYELQLDGKITTTEEALAAVRDS